MTISSEQALKLLQGSLKEAQDSVRAYDTKAQIVGVGYMFALNVIGSVGEVLEPLGHISLLTILIPWVFIIMPILFFGFVLYPTRKSTEKLSDGAEKTAKHILFVETTKQHSVKALKSAVYECDPLHEVAFELVKTSSLRELKRARFLRALFSASIAFIVLFTIHLFILYKQMAAGA